MLGILPQVIVFMRRYRRLVRLGIVSVVMRFWVKGVFVSRVGIRVVVIFVDFVMTIRVRESLDRVLVDEHGNQHHHHHSQLQKHPYRWLFCQPIARGHLQVFARRIGIIGKLVGV